MTDDESRPDTADEQDGQAATEGAGEQPGEGTPSTGRKYSPRFLGALGFAAVAFIAAVVFGVLWWTSATSDEYRVAKARDDVTAAADKGIKAYTEIDPKNPDAYRDSQQAISTKELFEQNKKGWEEARKQIKESEISVKVKVFDIGILELNSHKGEAVAVSALEITRSAKDMEPNTGRMRMIAKLQRVDDEWRLADIQHVPETGAGA